MGKIGSKEQQRRALRERPSITDARKRAVAMVLGRGGEGEVGRMA